MPKICDICGRARSSGTASAIPIRPLRRSGSPTCSTSRPRRTRACGRSGSARVACAPEGAKSRSKPALKPVDRNDSLDRGSIFLAIVSSCLMSRTMRLSLISAGRPLAVWTSALVMFAAESAIAGRHLGQNARRVHAPDEKPRPEQPVLGRLPRRPRPSVRLLRISLTTSGQRRAWTVTPFPEVM